MLTSIRFLWSIATTCDIEVEYMDMKTKFLTGDLEEKSTWSIYNDFLWKETKSFYAGWKFPYMG